MSPGKLFLPYIVSGQVFGHSNTNSDSGIILSRKKENVAQYLHKVICQGFVKIREDEPFTSIKTSLSY